jgi:hypothetical protein
MVLDKLPADEPRYLVMDWDVENDDGCQMSKIFFVSWVPDTCKAKTKMLYASSKQALRNALEGVHLDHQATDYDEITPAEFQRSLAREVMTRRRRRFGERRGTRTRTRSGRPIDYDRARDGVGSRGRAI